MLKGLENVTSPRRDKVIRKLRTRMQLKILLENKLKSKYCKQDVDFLAVEKFI